jgi:hypothetical protein
MAGARYLRSELHILAALEQGPKAKSDLQRSLGWDPVVPSRALDSILATMREARLVHCIGRGLWALAPGTVVCPHCHGRGLVEE